MELKDSFEQVKRDAEALTLKRLQEDSANAARAKAEDEALKARAQQPAPAPKAS